VSEQKKMSAPQRRKLIIDRLKTAKDPITGSEFAEVTNVSRQVIVQDISILKATGEQIIATSQGYMYVSNDHENLDSRVIAVQHVSDLVREELYMIVDHGVTVKDVLVEHSVYGDLRASIMVSTRAEVDQFVTAITKTNAAYLLTLTEGVHLHTLEADSTEKIDAACAALKKADFLLEM